MNEIIKGLAKDIYDDALKPSTQAIGTALGTVSNCLNMLLAPLYRRQLASKDKTKAFMMSLEEKYEDIPIHDRKEPDLKVVYQIAERLKYNLDDDELCRMFEALLISSMTKGKDVLPVYVSTVDQMSPKEAKLFKFIYDSSRQLFPGYILFKVKLITYYVKDFYGDIEFPCLVYPYPNTLPYGFPNGITDLATLQLNARELSLLCTTLNRAGLIREIDTIRAKELIIYEGSEKIIDKGVKIRTYLKKRFSDVILDLDIVKKWFERLEEGEGNFEHRNYTCRMRAVGYETTEFGRGLYSVLTK